MTDEEKQSEFESRLQRVEHRNRFILFGLTGCAVVALVALGMAVRALIPVLRVQSALRAAFASVSSSGATPENAGAVSGPAASEQPQTPDMQKLLSIIDVTAKAKRLLPKDPEAGRFSNEVELTLSSENHSARNVRAYEGTLEVSDLLGNQIILLNIENQTPLDAHRTQQFTQYFEMNEFINNQSHFAAESFENLAFKWKPEKVIFTDGTSMEARE